MRLALAVVILLASSAAAEVRATVDKLPQLGIVARGRARVVVRGEVTPAKAREALALVERVVGDVHRRFTAAAKTPDPEITLCLLPTTARFREVAQAAFGEVISTMGFYRPDHRVAMANLGDSIGNLRHELVHTLLDDDFPEIPAWLNEGIAALYGTARPGRRGFEFLVNYRLRDVHEALAAGALPTLDELATSTSAQVHGARAMVWYGLARYVLLFVERAGKLTELYGKLRAAPGDARAHRAILAAYVDEAAFRRWVKGLRF